MTIKDLLNRAAAESPDWVVLRYKRNRVWQPRNYRELKARPWNVAEMLGRLGAKVGMRVAIHCENSPEWYELYLGGVGFGAIAVPVDAKLREQELAHIFHDCEVSIVFQ